MPISATRHLDHQRFVTCMQRRELSLPAKRFGMSRVADLSLDEDVPEPVKLAVLSEKMLTAEHGRRKIPDSHRRKKTGARRGNPAREYGGYFPLICATMIGRTAFQICVPVAVRLCVSSIAE